MITSMQIGICKKPVNAVSEDVVGYAGKYFWLLDGATPFTGGQNKHLLQMFLGYLNTGLVKNSAMAKNPQALLYQAICYARKYMRKDGLLIGVEHKPRCTAIVVKVGRENAEFSVLGDSVLCFIDNIDGTCHSITDNRLADFAVEERERLEASEFDTDGYWKAADALIEAEKEFINKPNGFWEASINPEAAYMSVNGLFDFKNDTTILMMSDGLARFVDVFKRYKDYGGIAKLIKENGADNAFTQLRSLERSMRAVRRPSLHDDASFLMLDVRKG